MPFSWFWRNWEISWIWSKESGFSNCEGCGDSPSREISGCFSKYRFPGDGKATLAILDDDSGDWDGVVLLRAFDGVERTGLIAQSFNFTLPGPYEDMDELFLLSTSEERGPGDPLDFDFLDGVERSMGPSFSGDLEGVDRSIGSPLSSILGSEGTASGPDSDGRLFFL